MKTVGLIFDTKSDKSMRYAFIFSNFSLARKISKDVDTFTEILLNSKG